MAEILKIGFGKGFNDSRSLVEIVFCLGSSSNLNLVSSFATTTFISIIENFRPMQLRGPFENGMNL